MNCEERNRLLAGGELDRDDLWPKIDEYESRRYQFRWEFGLESLPEEPGLISVRGPRQYGKSTWLEFKLLDTVEKYGAGSCFILNGDEIYSHEEFENKILGLEAAYPKKAKVKRLFIDEITSIQNWEKVIKRMIDGGRLRDVLIVTTGSNASDLRRGAERLPGRKGRLARNDYVFLPIAYREYLYTVRGEIGTRKDDDLFGYLLSGGSPLAMHELGYDEHLNESFLNLVKDWLVGDIVSSGRSRTFLMNLMRRIYEHGASTVSYTKLAREAGLANNSAALDYIEKLADLYCLLPAMQWDHVGNIRLAKKPSKMHFINLAVAMAFHPSSPRYLHEVRNMKGREKAAIYEWAVAQELWRRMNLNNQRQNKRQVWAEDLAYWASGEHEIDFVTPDGRFFEVKAGPASAMEFAWFEGIFPKGKLTVICDTPFESRAVKGVTLHQFLLGEPSELYYDEDKYKVITYSAATR
ncbi:MAG: ATP-binding protein [Deltaproteobacteria bacterium]|nr:ATP-binding protein [Deltaproteobacteria bacterium]